jgi:hypothetical protein
MASRICKFLDQKRQVHTVDIAYIFATDKGTVPTNEKRDSLCRQKYYGSALSRLNRRLRDRLLDVARHLCPCILGHGAAWRHSSGALGPAQGGRLRTDEDCLLAQRCDRWRERGEPDDLGERERLRTAHECERAGDDPAPDIVHPAEQELPERVAGRQDDVEVRDRIRAQCGHRPFLGELEQGSPPWLIKCRHAEVV